MRVTVLKGYALVLLREISLASCLQFQRDLKYHLIVATIKIKRRHTATLTMVHTHIHANTHTNIHCILRNTTASSIPLIPGKRRKASGYDNEAKNW